MLYARIHGGPAVTFVWPLSIRDAKTFWRDQVMLGVNAGTRRALLPGLTGEIIWTVRISLQTEKPLRIAVRDPFAVGGADR